MLSNRAQLVLQIMSGSEAVGEELANAINAAEALSPAADVAAVSPGTVAAITVTTSGGDTYSDSTLNTALASAVADIQANRTAINAILTALKSAGLMS